MKRDLLRIATSRAIASLASTPTSKVQKIPLLECAFMLTALPATPELNGLRSQLANRLSQQLSTPLWIHAANAYDVFSVLVALWKHNPKRISGDHLASAVQRLVKNEVAVGGPYYSQGIIATPANAQIAAFMRLVAAPLPNVDAFLADVVAAKRFGDTELPIPHLLYLLASAHADPHLGQYVARHWQDNNWQTPTRMAVALTILRGVAPTNQLDRALATLCAWQLHSGLWQAEPPYSSFSATALIIEVLTKYQPSPSQGAPSDIKRRQHAIALAARKMFRACDEPLRSSAFAAIKHMCSADKNFEITLLPQFFADALTSHQLLSDNQRTTLGLASLYVWIAYTIYDDFLDGEAQPAKLPVANVAMRASLDCFRTILPNQNRFQRYVAQIFTAMDETNAWEVEHCRFTVEAGKVAIAKLPNYGGCGVLATRSFAHALAPIAVLARQSPDKAQVYASRVEPAFRHYLIARQLNDDLHDWLKDMQAGQASYVVTAVLRDLHIKPGTYTLSALVPAMQKRFRKTTMLRVCQRILRHTNLSKQAFIKSHLLQTTNNVYTLLDELEKSVQLSMDTHSKSQAFTLVKTSKAEA